MSSVKRDTEEAELSQVQEANPSVPNGTSYLELFRSGRHADVIIECNGQQFPVHKAILETQCGWFRESFKDIGEGSQQLEPGMLPIIEVTSHQPIEIEAILVFIYSGEIDPSCFPDDEFPAACVRLYDLGHIFTVTNLSDFATTGLGIYLSNMLKSICDVRLWVPADNSTIYRRTELQHRLREDNFMTKYLAAVERADLVRRAGRTDMERLRPYQMLVDFFLAGENVLLAEPEFELWLESDVVPSFAKVVLLTRKRGGYRTKWMQGLVAKAPTRGRPGLCVDCQAGLKNIKECGGLAWVNPKSRSGLHTQGVCKRCVEKERNLGEDGLPRWDIFNPRKEED